MPRPSQYPWSDHPSNVRWRIVTNTDHKASRYAVFSTPRLPRHCYSIMNSSRTNAVQDINRNVRVFWELYETHWPIPISRPTDATCDRFLFSIYMCKTLHVSSVKRSSSGVPHRTYSLQFLCLCLPVALSCKKLMMSAWRSKHVELYTYR
jgi:hypothetical protein